MADIRPKLVLTNGRVQQPLRVQLLDLLVGSPYKTVLTADVASGSGTLTIQNITGFAINQILLIGDPGNQSSEIIKTHASTPPSGSTITLASNTVQNHSSSTFVYLLPYDQAEFSNAATITGSKSVLATTTFLANQFSTTYDDSANTSGFGFARFKNSITSGFSPYSDPAPYAGYGVLSARAVIDAALQEINKRTSEVLSDVFFFTQLDLYQSEVIREFKRWSWLQSFDNIIGQASTGSWKVAMPATIDDTNTNKSAYQFRMGTQFRMRWVDKQKFDELIGDMAYTTLSVIANVNDTTLTLTNSSDFGTSGTAYIGAYTYAYTANNTSTGVLTLSAAIPNGQNQAVGADVFINPQMGLPAYWTTWGDGFIHYTPVTDSTYNGFNLYLDFYLAQTRITSDNQNILPPDPTAAVNYLCWKALKKLNNGEETDASLAYKSSYEDRRTKMKQKEVLGTTFKLRPRFNNWAVQSFFDDNDTRWQRDAAFPNTGF